jgi:hypothetical protein
MRLWLTGTERPLNHLLRELADEELAPTLLNPAGLKPPCNLNTINFAKPGNRSPIERLSHAT